MFASEILKASELRRDAIITAAAGICGIIGYAFIAVGIKLLVSCVKKKQYFFIKKGYKRKIKAIYYTDHSI